MGGNQKRRQQMAAKKKARRQKRVAARNTGGAPSWNWPYSKSEVRKAPLHRCWVAEQLFETGIGQVFMTRRLPSGDFFAGGFLLDAYCLGVKDAFPIFLDERELQAMIDRANDSGNALREVTPAHVVKLVEGARAYAKDLGFAPHEDYHDAAVVFGDIDPAGCSEEFVFGRDGKPLFVAGPHDSPEKIRRIIATLRTRCGEGHYDILTPMAETLFLDDGDEEDVDDLDGEEEDVDEEDIEASDMNFPEEPNLPPPRSSV